MAPFDKDDARRVWEEINDCKVQLATLDAGIKNYNEELSRTRRRLHELENERTGLTLSKEVMDSMKTELGDVSKRVAGIEAQRQLTLWLLGVGVPVLTSILLFVLNLASKKILGG